MNEHTDTVGALRAFIARLRPCNPDDAAMAAESLRLQCERLRQQPEEARQLGNALRELLALPNQAAFYAETGIHSALGFWLEFTHRLGDILLPTPPDPTRLRDVLAILFEREDDALWVAAIDDEAWLQLLRILGFNAGPDADKESEEGAAADFARPAMDSPIEALRMLSYRLAGAGLDRELLHAEPDLERHESPFIAQNALLIPLLDPAQPEESAIRFSAEHARDVDVMLAQCQTVLDKVRRKATEKGVSIRLTYLLARMHQLIRRMRSLIDLLAAEDKAPKAVALTKELLAAEAGRRQLLPYLGTSVSLLARNVTDHASRHGEHYIAESRDEWKQMARSAAGGGIVIAFMALMKNLLGHLHLPPLTEGIVFGLNYALGFVAIHLLGFTVATKQPAMTAAAIAATLEETRPRELGRLVHLVQNVIRTQFVAVLGNVGVALPLAVVIALSWKFFFGAPPVSPEKAVKLLGDVHPFASGALFFAAIAGVGLFLSGLVSGYFDNRARYRNLAARIAYAPRLRWLGAERLQRLGEYMDAHYGAILGNLFFGLYLGLAGAAGTITGLPIDIRHVAFASANLGTTLTVLDKASLAHLIPWALAGVAGIALVNLAVSFGLALYVAMKSRGLGAGQMIRLGGMLLRQFVQAPHSFFLPPKAASTES